MINPIVPDSIDPSHNVYPLHNWILRKDILFLIEVHHKVLAECPTQHGIINE